MKGFKLLSFNREVSEIKIFYLVKRKQRRLDKFIDERPLQMKKTLPENIHVEGLVCLPRYLSQAACCLG